MRKKGHVMKKMKKNIIIIILFCLICSIPVKAENNGNKENHTANTSYSFDGNMEKNKGEYNRYLKFVRGRNQIEGYTLHNDENYITTENLDEELSDLLDHDFFELKQIKRNLNVKLVESVSEKGINSSIMYDSENDIYFYVETDKNDQNLLFYINEDKYILQEEYGNYYLISESGSKLPLIETEHIENNLKSNELFAAQASWILLGSNMKKTNKAWVQVLSIISVVTGGGSLIKGMHPVIGVISFVTSVAATVGDKLFVTFYIIYSQSYRSDCTSYMKEVDNYYQYSNYTGFIKSQTVYFHTERPDYAGQNCLAYN